MMRKYWDCIKECVEDICIYILVVFRVIIVRPNDSFTSAIYAVCTINPYFFSTYSCIILYVHPKALKKIIGYGVERLIYISCKPTSLVRDLEVFLENGYEVERVAAVDQFPWTANVETIVLLSQSKTVCIFLSLPAESPIYSFTVL